DQSAGESDKLGHGFFTAALLDALVKGDENQNGTIELHEIAAYVQRLTPEISRLRLAVANVDMDWISPVKRGVAATPGFSQQPRIGSNGYDFALVRRLDPAALASLNR